MTSKVISIDPEATQGEAAELMARHQIGCLPVVSTAGALLGLVRETDLVRATLL